MAFHYPSVCRVPEVRWIPLTVYHLEGNSITSDASWCFISLNHWPLTFTGCNKKEFLKIKWTNLNQYINQNYNGNLQKQQAFQLFPPWPIPKPHQTEVANSCKSRVARSSSPAGNVRSPAKQTQLLNGLGGFTFIFMWKNPSKSSLFWGVKFFRLRWLMVFHTAFGSENLAWIWRVVGCSSFLSVFPPTKKYVEQTCPQRPPDSPCAPDCHGAPVALITPFKTQRGTARSCPPQKMGWWEGCISNSKVEKKQCPETKSCFCCQVKMIQSEKPHHILTWVKNSYSFPNDQMPPFSLAGCSCPDDQKQHPTFKVQS